MFRLHTLLHCTAGAAMNRLFRPIANACAAFQPLTKASAAPIAKTRVAFQPSGKASAAPFGKASAARSFSTLDPVKPVVKSFDLLSEELLSTWTMIVGGIASAGATAYWIYQENKCKSLPVQISKTACGALAGGCIGGTLGLFVGTCWYISIPVGCAIYAVSDAGKCPCNS